MERLCSLQSIFGSWMQLASSFEGALFLIKTLRKSVVFMIRSILEDPFWNCSRHPPQSLGGTTCTRLESGGAALSALTPVPCMESHIHLGLASWLQGHPPQRQLSSATKNQHMAYQHMSITRTSLSKNWFYLGVKFQEFTSEAMHPVENDYVCNIYRYIYLKGIRVCALEGSYSHHSSQEAGFLHCRQTKCHCVVNTPSPRKVPQRKKPLECTQTQWFWKV